MKRLYTTLIALFATAAMCVAQNIWAVKLVQAGTDKSAVISVVASWIGPDHEAATGIVENAPVVLLSPVVKEKAEDFANQLRAAGATAEVTLVIDSEAFPDNSFQATLSAFFDKDEDGCLSQAEIDAVTELFIPGNYIDDLKGIEFFTALKSLDCSGNYLRALDLSKNTALQTLNCSYNQLAALDLKANTKLEQVLCNDNRLTTLDVTGCLSLFELYCQRNKLRGDGMTALIASLSSTDAIKSGSLYVLDTTISDIEGNICTSNHVADAESKQWNVYACENALQGFQLYAGSDPSGASDIKINTKNFPDDIFRNIVATKYDTNDDGMLSEAERDLLISIDISGSGIESLEGIEYFTALEFLDCSSNPIRELDLSKNTALKDLNCSGNYLRALDVSKNTALEMLICFDNWQLTALDPTECTKLKVLDCSNADLSTLDVTGLTKLEQLHCHINQLTALDLSTNSALEVLDCSYNQLTALDLSGCPNLFEVNCRRNKIRRDNMNTLVNSLKDRDSLSPGSLCIITLSNGAERNACNKEQVAVATGKNWEVKAYNYDTNEYEAYVGTDPVPVVNIAINETNFPDDNFRNFIAAEYDTNGDSFLNNDEIDEVYAISVYERDIVSLKGIEFFTEMTYLSCENNPIDSLDLTGCAKLETLHCYNTSLTKLDVSGCANLFGLYCDYTNLTELDLSKNTKLQSLNCSSCRLDSLDLSKNTQLTELYCQENRLRALDLSANPVLYVLNCSVNQLDSLDLSKNTNLSSLHCSFNALTALDLNSKAQLYSLDCSSNQLTALDLSDASYLSYLYCSGNALTKLDVSGCTSLMEVSCNVNKLSGDAMTAFVNSLCDRTMEYAGYVLLYEYPNDSEGNVCTTAQVAIATGKNWKVKAWNNDTHEEEDYAGSEPTAIRNVETSDGTASAAGWYGIDGKKLPAEPTQRGIYIHGGRKVVK